MKVKVFLESAGNFDERDILKNFYDGIKKFENTKSDVPTDRLEVDWAMSHGYEHCDVAVIMGSWKDRDRIHHNVRRDVVKNAPTFVVVETPLLGRVMFERSSQHRIGIDGFLNNTGTFLGGNAGNDRLSALDIKWNGWNNNPNGHIVLMLQLPGDASLRGINMWQWGMWAYQSIRKYTNKKIIIRTHPGHHPKEMDAVYKFISDVSLNEDKNVEVVIGSKERPLASDLKDAYCTVSYSSGSSIDSVLAGIPTIAMDPGNFAYGISSNYIEHIDGDNIRKASDGDVVQWLQNLSYSQWSVLEMASGRAWQHLKPILDTKFLESHLNRRKGIKGKK